MRWQWEPASRSYGNYGNANQWTVNAGMASLARESAQNTNDARLGPEAADLEYTFIRLTGENRRSFENAVGWDELSKHLRAMAANADAAVTAGQIKDGVKALDAQDDLVLLQISDYGCKGLTGPEFRDVPSSEYGNFIKLCRLDLFSGKDEAAGGSFGLGKAVYWRFSRLQTVLFNSCLSEADAVDGRTQNRLFGVNAGVIHDCDGQSIQGRGYFGVMDGSDISSAWVGDAEAEALHVKRPDSRPGTTTLLIGFYDPDEPAGSSSDTLVESARRLRQGIEESFWPLLARGRLRVTIRVLDNAEVILEETADPAETYTELVRALNRFDSDTLDDSLDEPDSVIALDIPVSISARKDGIKDHESFVHTAKLVVTLSDAQPDTLENSVCLIRRPEMVVQTLGREFEGRSFHAFLLAGASITPSSPSHQDLLADDFLRFAEPPAHDRWIPGSGRNQASQANLTGRFVPPWIPNLKGIEKSIIEALYGLFGAPPPVDGRAPEAILRNLRFLRGEAGQGGSGSTVVRKPQVQLTDWVVEDDRWHVTFEISVPNRGKIWSIDPALRFVGLDHKKVPVAWERPPQIVSGSAVLHEGRIRMSPAKRTRKLTAVLRGVSSKDLPIPAREAAIAVVIASAEEVSGAAAEPEESVE